MDYAKIWNEAQAAAKKAAEEVGQRMDDGGSCGYAWVRIMPARGPFVSWCRKQNEIANHGVEVGRERNPYGERRTWGSGGWQIWGPGGYAGQCLCAKEAGAKAFADVLKASGIPGEIWDESRVD